jgi:hypothetical protein
MPRLLAALLVLSCALILYAATDAPPSLLRSDAPAVQVDVTVRPINQDAYQLLHRPIPGMYRCSVLVHDEPGGKRVWGTPDIVIAPGETREEVSDLPQLQLRFRAGIRKAGDQVNAEVTLTRDGRVVSRQISTVCLQPLPRSVAP